MRDVVRRRLRVALPCVLALVAVVWLAPAALADEGNSENAKACQKGGWALLTTSSGESFANQGDCVSYGAQGGTLVPKTQSQLDCESFGSVYSTDPATDLSGIVNLPGGVFIWSCNGVRLTGAQFNTLTADCIADTNGLFAFGNANQSANYSCFRF
jgi:hypothetical protein